MIPIAKYKQNQRANRKQCQKQCLVFLSTNLKSSVVHLSGPGALLPLKSVDGVIKIFDCDMAFRDANGLFDNVSWVDFCGPLIGSGPLPFSIYYAMASARSPCGTLWPLMSLSLVKFGITSFLANLISLHCSVCVPSFVVSQIDGL